MNYKQTYLVHELKDSCNCQDSKPDHRFTFLFLTLLLFLDLQQKHRVAILCLHLELEMLVISRNADRQEGGLGLGVKETLILNKI